MQYYIILGLFRPNVVAVLLVKFYWFNIENELYLYEISSKREPKFFYGYIRIQHTKMLTSVIRPQNASNYLENSGICCWGLFLSYINHTAAET